MSEPTDTTTDVLGEVAEERARQDAKWGEQNHPNFMPGDQRDGPRHYAGVANEWKKANASRVRRLSEYLPSDRNAAWDGILLEEVYEALGEHDDAKIRAELIQVAAVAINWIEAIDRRTEESR